jgi:hypothetical protein
VSAPIDPNDPTTWPVVDCEPTDVFLGEFTHDCAPHLTEEQKTWPVADCEPADVFIDPPPRQPPPPRPGRGSDQ